MCIKDTIGLQCYRMGMGGTIFSYKIQIITAGQIDQVN